MFIVDIIHSFAAQRPAEQQCVVVRRCLAVAGQATEHSAPDSLLQNLDVIFLIHCNRNPCFVNALGEMQGGRKIDRRIIRAHCEDQLPGRIRGPFLQLYADERRCDAAVYELPLYVQEIPIFLLRGKIFPPLRRHISIMRKVEQGLVVRHIFVHLAAYARVDEGNDRPAAVACE